LVWSSIRTLKTVIVIREKLGRMEYRGYPHGVPEGRLPGEVRHLPGSSRGRGGEEAAPQDNLVTQEHSLQLVDNLRKIYDDEDCFLYDVILCSKDQGEVKAHKIILAAQSEYFKGMFRNEKKEKIEMNLTAATLRTVVRTLYTGKTEINTENIQDLLEASNYLQIRDLSTRCVDFMTRNLDLSNVVSVLRLADTLSIERLLQEAINYIGDHFQKLLEGSEDLQQLPVELFAKCIKSDRIILYSKFGTVLPAIQREEALVGIIVQYVKYRDYEVRVRDTWPLFRALKLPFIAHHLDFRSIGLPDLANFEDDPTLHSLIRSSRIPKEDDLRRRYSVDPFSKHNSHLRSHSVKYNIWTERFGSGPMSAYREVRPFSCEGGPDKFIRCLRFWFRVYDEKKVLGGVKVVWSNGSTDVAGDIPNSSHSSPHPPLEEKVAELGEGEHFQKLELRSAWWVDNIKLTTNKGKVFGPWGGEGGEEKKPHRQIRKGVNARHVYLDGLRGHVVQAQGGFCINRLSFKWGFVMDRKVSRYNYHHSVVLRAECERVSVLELEREISLTEPEEGRREWHHPRFFAPPMAEDGAYMWSDEDEMWSPPHLPHHPHWPGHNQEGPAGGDDVGVVQMEEEEEEEEREDEDPVGDNGGGEGQQEEVREQADQAE